MSYLGRSAKLSLKAQEKVSFLATAGQTVKTGLSYTPSFVEVYVNGVLLTDTTDFTATIGSIITFTVALLLNDEVTVISLKTFTVADHYSKTEADTLLAAKATNTALALKAPIASPSFTGNVGIGTSSPAVQNNGAGIVLDLANTGSASTTADNAELVVRSSSRYTALTFITPTDKASTINFGDTADSNIGIIQYNHANDAMSFNTNNAEAMRIDSAGIVTKPLQPAFMLTKIGSQTVSATTETTVSFQTEVFDANSDCTSGVFTAPVDGIYVFKFVVRFDQPDRTATYHDVRILTSGQAFKTLKDFGGYNSSAYETMANTIITQMDAGDTATPSVYIAAGAGTQALSADTTRTHFSGYLLG